ncbi:MAG: hypothetical protein AB1640_12790 [bacterium]
MENKMPHTGHEEHMCYLVNIRTDLSKLKELARDAKFICKNCARAAKEKKNLCNAESL